MRVWDLDAEKSMELQAHPRSMLSLEPVPGGDAFLTCDRDQQAKYWKFADVAAPIFDHGDLVQTEVSFEVDRAYVAYQGLMGNFYLCYDGVEEMAISADESRAATVQYDGELHIWALDEMRQQADFDLAAAPAIRSSLTDDDHPAARHWVRQLQAAGDGDCAGMAFSRDNARLLTVDAGDEGGKVTIWEIGTGKALQTFDGPKEYVDIASSPGTDIVAIGSSDEDFVRPYDLAANKEAGQIKIGEKIEYVAIDEPGKILFVADNDTIKLFDLKSRSNLREVKLSKEVDGIVVSPDETLLAALEANFGGTQMHLFVTTSRASRSPRRRRCRLLATTPTSRAIASTSCFAV